MSASPTALCSRCRLQALRKSDEGRHPRSEIRSAQRRGTRIRRAAGRGHPPACRAGATRNACDPGASPPRQACCSADSTRRDRSLSTQFASLRKTHPRWRLALASSTLMRLRSTASQAGLRRVSAAKMCVAHSVSDPSAVEGRHLFLIDDIYTTGATARAASQALIKAGAATVWVATLARARRIYQIRTGFFRHVSRCGRQTRRTRPSQAEVSQVASMHSSPNQRSF